MFQDWFIEGVSTISNVIIGLSAIAVAAIGFAGLQQWRRELRGKSRFELARRIAVIAFDFRDRFHTARNPFTFAGEYADRTRAPDETPQATNVLDEWHARGKRLEELRTAGRLLHEASWEASVLLDEEVTQLILPLENSLRDLSVSFQTYFQSQMMNANRPHAPARDQEWLQPHHRTVYGTSDDPIAMNVDQGVEDLVKNVRKYIR